MAINKVVNRASKTHGAMRNVIRYVLRDEKIKEGYVTVTGPYSSNAITHNDIYRDWLAEKKLWKKDSGRMYAHNIISFHKDEAVTPEDVFNIGQAFADKFFSNYQCLIGVHQDKDHLHCHIISNSVSFIDGHKLHQTKKDLERQKIFTNTICLERGLSIAEKGHHFDGSAVNYGEPISWDKNKFKLLSTSPDKSYLVSCAKALNNSLRSSVSKEAFIAQMKNHHWDVKWENKRKHIVFIDDKGHKVRDSNISKTFSIEIDKDSLQKIFERNHQISMDKSEIISSEENAVNKIKKKRRIRLC